MSLDAKRTRRLVLRADAGQERGHGHVMRSLTVGEGFVRRGWSVQLLGSDLDCFLEKRAKRCGIAVIPLACEVGSRADAEMTCNFNADLVVTDGYDFGPEYFGCLEARGVSLLVIDDNGESVAPGALLTVNQNPHASFDMYPELDRSRLLLGSTYALIRNEILCAQRATRGGDGSQPQVLVSVGGTDVRNLNFKVADALTVALDAKIEVSHPEPPMGAKRALRDISMSLSSADVAVIGAGSTLWEACFLGTPTVAVVVADNQAGASRVAHELGVCVQVDCRRENRIEGIVARVKELINNRQLREVMSARGRCMVDGSGVVRTIDRCLQVLGPPKFP